MQYLHTNIYVCATIGIEQQGGKIDLNFSIFNWKLITTEDKENILVKVYSSVPLEKFTYPA